LLLSPSPTKTTALVSLEHEHHGFDHYQAQLIRYAGRPPGTYGNPGGTALLHEFFSVESDVRRRSSCLVRS